MALLMGVAREVVGLRIKHREEKRKEGKQQQQQQKFRVTTHVLPKPHKSYNTATSAVIQYPKV